MGAPLPDKNRSKNRCVNAGGVQQAHGIPSSGGTAQSASGSRTDIGGRYNSYSNRRLPYSGSSECASAFFLISRSSFRSPTSSWISVSGTSADNHMCQQV